MKIALIDEHCSSPIVKMAEIKKKKKKLGMMREETESGQMTQTHHFFLFSTDHFCFMFVLLHQVN